MAKGEALMVQFLRREETAPHSVAQTGFKDNQTGYTIKFALLNRQGETGPHQKLIQFPSPKVAPWFTTSTEVYVAL